MTRRAVPLADEVWHYQALNGQLVPRRLRTYRTAPGHVAAILTEAPHDHGMSITNAAAEINQQLRARFPHERVEQIEHWPTAPGPGGGEHFDRVLIGAGHTVTWQRIPRAEITAQFGPDLTGPS
jgi:hypothetical protein